MLKWYRMAKCPSGTGIIAMSSDIDGFAISSAHDIRWVRYEEVEPLLKRLAELEAKEQKREQFDRESA